MFAKKHHITEENSPQDAGCFHAGHPASIFRVFYAEFLLLFCFLHAASEKVNQKKHKDNKAYKLRSSDAQFFTEID